jgi:hypothetical protein
MGRTARNRAVEKMSLADSVERIAALMTRLAGNEGPQRDIAAVTGDGAGGRLTLPSRTGGPAVTRLPAIPSAPASGADAKTVSVT